ncbi:MAG: hypothetical protein WC490_04905 [Candidatus Margulisiibacteriota bacterium]
MSIEGTVRLANTNDAVQDETRDTMAEMYDVKNETLLAMHKKAEKIADDARSDAFFGALGSIGKAIFSIF